MITGNCTLTIIPGKNKIPIPITLEENCEALAHSYLFLTKKFGYTWKKNISVSPSKSFNRKLLNYLQRFSSDSDWIVFPQSVVQHLFLNYNIKIAMQKIKTEELIADMLSQNYKGRMRMLVASDEAFF